MEIGGSFEARNAVIGAESSDEFLSSDAIAD
jgi:hypothetical protein